MVNYSCI